MVEQVVQQTRAPRFFWPLVFSVPFVMVGSVGFIWFHLVPSSVAHRMMIVGWSGLAILWMLVMIWRLYGWANQDLQLALTPVQSPPQIADQLQQEWGRAPTVVEVAAIHQMMTSQRAEAAVTTAAKYAFIYELGKTAKGRKP